MIDLWIALSITGKRLSFRTLSQGCSSITENENLRVESMPSISVSMTDSQQKIDGNL